jgi:hypothetical protein
MISGKMKQMVAKDVKKLLNVMPNKPNKRLLDTTVSGPVTTQGLMGLSGNL